jgi:hypothetical protein
MVSTAQFISAHLLQIAPANGSLARLQDHWRLGGIGLVPWGKHRGR